MARIQVNDAAWPVLMIVYPPARTLADEEGYYAEIKRYMLRREVFGMVVDAQVADIPQAAERARIAAFLRETSELSARYVAAMGTVMLTAGGRGVLTALLWLIEPPFPIQPFGTVAEARRWVEQKVQEKQKRRASIPPPRP